MKSYDSIEYYGQHWGIPIVAFDKLDGSNIRFEWSGKRGFYKFGSRNVMIDESNEQFGFSINLFKEKYEKALTEIFKSKDYRDTLSFTCFAELIGKKSCFGQHDFESDEFDVVLFDVFAYKKGFIPPRKFVKDFGDLGIPRVVYEGNLNEEFVQSVKSNEYGLSEGVICKGVIKNRKENDNLYYCKIKTNDWFERLRNRSVKDFEQEIQEANRKNKTTPH